MILVIYSLILFLFGNPYNLYIASIQIKMLPIFKNLCNLGDNKNNYAGKYITLSIPSIIVKIGIDCNYYLF